MKGDSYIKQMLQQIHAQVASTNINQGMVLPHAVKLRSGQ